MSATSTNTLGVLVLEGGAEEAETLSEYLRAAFNREPVESGRPDSDRIRVEVYFDRVNEAILAGELVRVRFPGRHVSIRPCRAEHWETFWRHHFKPRRIGQRLLICPVWERERVRAGKRRVVLINPGLSFGTGDHFTTRFCLEMIDRLCVAEDPESLLDVGCGSGILAIAAARLGIPRVVGMDNDPHSIQQSRQNSILNGVDQCIEWREASLDTGFVHEVTDANGKRAGAGRVQYPSPGTDVGTNRNPKDPDRERYRIVCANLYASLLINSASSLLNCGSGYWILSGIRHDETDSVVKAFTCLGLRVCVRDGDGEWSGLLLEQSRDVHQP